MAISLAKEGLNAEEISVKTGLPLEEIEPIIKYHGSIWSLHFKRISFTV